MKKQGQSVGVKGKVLSGFFILLILALGAVFAVIKLATQLSPPETGASESVIKLTLVSNLLSELIEANGQARAYITTGEKRYLARYRRLDKGILKLADSLKYFSTMQPEQYKRMLVVDSLLKIKRGTIESFFRITRANDTLDSNRNNQTGMTGRDADSSLNNGRVSPRIISDRQIQDVEDGSKPGFFKKIWDNITGRKPRKDSLQRINPQFVSDDSIRPVSVIQDTTIEMVKSQLQIMGEKERLDKEMTIKRDLLLMRTDQVIMDEIRNVLLLFEKEEINRALEDAVHQREVFRRLWYTAVVLAAVGLITMIFFVILIWKDLARSNFYRKQLESARHLAEKLLKVKELFLANMSHEIRTPITSIIGFTERLSTTRLSGEQENYLKYINSSSEHLLGLVDDLLDYSRIESGKFNLDVVAFLPADLFRQVFETIKHKAERKGLEMNYSSTLEPGLAVLGDPLRIRQIVYNLLNNSIKFTEAGKVNLNLSSTPAGDQIQLIFSVSDTGIGIPEDKQQEIFGEFTQVDVGITRKYGGSGLGLAICRKLVDLMKGEIFLESKPGSGTNITTSLPLDVYQGTIEELIREYQGISVNLSGYRILLAEDDETTRILIHELLKSAGAQVDAAGDGLAAWKLFSEHPSEYDLIMTDIQMPNISGPELAGKIKLHFGSIGSGTPPVMGLTAHATNDDLELFREKGIASFLIKPFRQIQLFEAIGKVLKIEMMSDSRAGKSGPEEGRNIDLEAFAKFAGDDHEAMIKILNSLSENLITTSGQMQTAFDSADYQHLALLAHRILPNIRNLGAKEEVAMLTELESLRRETDFDRNKISEILNKTKSGMAELNEVIRQKTLNY
ncbi:MAG: two-component system sensor histidine kinase [Bacteroidetes bacterium]|nr:MAG: two-component system sensor histidine kinase [Bacteroidota bacterium]